MRLKRAHNNHDKKNGYIKLIEAKISRLSVFGIKGSDDLLKASIFISKICFYFEIDNDKQNR